MPSFKPEKYNYHTLMSATCGPISYPEELKQKHWRKAKGKLAPATGLGGMLADCEAAYKKVKWEFVSARTLGDMDGEAKRLKAWYSGGPVKNLAAELKKVAVKAKQVAAEYKKAKLVPKKSAEAAEEVRFAADWLTVTLNKNSMGTMLEDALKERRAELLAKAKRSAGTNIMAAAAVRKKIPASLKVAAEAAKTWTPETEAESRGKIGSKLRDLCRDCTQPLGNMMKAQKAGASYEGFDEKAAAALYKKMVKVSDSKTWTDVYGGKSKPEMVNEIRTVKTWCDEFVKVTTPVKEPS